MYVGKINLLEVKEGIDNVKHLKFNWTFLLLSQFQQNYFMQRWYLTHHQFKPRNVRLDAAKSM